MPTSLPRIDWSRAPPDPAMIASALTSYGKAARLDPTAVTTVEKRLLDVDGKPFVVVVDESTDTPLLVGDRTPAGEWLWREASLGLLGEKRGLLMGAAGGGNNMGPGDFDRIQSIQTKEFRLSLVYQDMTMVEPNEGDFRFDILRWLLQTARYHDMPVLLHPVVWHKTLPPWLNWKSDSELRRSLLDYVRATVNQLGQAGWIGQPIIVVVNEAYASGDDPASNGWGWGAPMPTPRQGMAAVTAPNGKIYTIGGDTPGDLHLSTVEIYDPCTNTWSAGPPLNTGRRDLAAAVGRIGGQWAIFAIGGNPAQAPYTTVESLLIDASPPVTAGCTPAVTDRSGNPGPGTSHSQTGSSAWSSTASTGFGIDEGYRNPQFLTVSGATWQRVIVPWPAVQPTGPNDFSHLGQTLPQAELQVELSRGVRLAGLLQFTPGWAQAQPDQGERSVPKNLDLPFDDPNNYFGRYVYETVRHYAGQIDEWVIWNEPEFKQSDAGVGGSFTWTGTDEQFARLLKVGYLAAKRANPNARVSFPGTSYWVDVENGNRPQFYQRILNLLQSQTDPDRDRNNWCHDAVALNLYRNPDDVLRVHEVYASIQHEHGLNKPMWLTETNAMPTDDPQVGCVHAIGGIVTTMQQQAAFAIQAFAMAAAAGYERAGFYQMVDDHPCNQPAVWGALRDDGSHRPVADALRTAMTNLSGFDWAKFVPLRRSAAMWPAWPDESDQYVPNWQVYQVAFDKPGNARVTVLWNGDATPTCVAVRRNGTDARAIDRSGNPVTVQRHGDTWQVTLGGASAHFDLDPQGYYFIGGDPVLLIESGVDSTTPVQPPSTSCN